MSLTIATFFYLFYRDVHEFFRRGDKEHRIRGWIEPEVAEKLREKMKKRRREKREWEFLKN